MKGKHKFTANGQCGRVFVGIHGKHVKRTSHSNSADTERLISHFISYSCLPNVGKYTNKSTKLYRFSNLKMDGIHFSPTHKEKSSRKSRQTEMN